MSKVCVLNPEKTCDDCGECERCDLDPSKRCDNCMRCIRQSADFKAVAIDRIYQSEEDEWCDEP